MGKVAYSVWKGEIKTKIYKDEDETFAPWRVFYTWDNQMYWGGFRTHVDAIRWACRMHQDRKKMIGK